MLAEYSGATTEFPAYNMTQMLCHSAVRTPSQPRCHPEVLETVAQQDETIRGIAATKEEQLDAPQEGMVQSDPSDSSDDDYRNIPQMPPRRQDHEAGSSSLAPPTPQIDPALLAILEQMRQDQARQAQETAATFAQFRPGRTSSSNSSWLCSSSRLYNSSSRPCISSSFSCSSSYLGLCSML